jgi:putative phage-type endonuclease
MTITRTVLNPSPAPGSPEWMRLMTASKVASVMRLSPYKSRMKLWLQMAGQIPPDEETDAMAEGTIFEPGIRDCFVRKHLEWLVTLPDGLHVRSDIPWAGATPDGYVKTPDGMALLECKRSRTYWKWGKPGTDEVPMEYRCQAMWQMHITGIHRVYFSADICGQVSEYVVDYDVHDAEAMAAECHEFMGTLPGQPGERRPDIDADSSTYEAIRRLHPGIDPDEQVEVGAELGSEYMETKVALEEAERAHRLAKSHVLDLMGDARIGTTGGIKAFRRQPAGKNVALHTIKQKAA